jgi:hypothetical protein
VAITSAGAMIHAMGCRSLRVLVLRPLALRVLVLRPLALCAATGLPPDRPLPNTPLPRARHVPSRRSPCVIKRASCSHST